MLMERNEQHHQKLISEQLVETANSKQSQKNWARVDAELGDVKNELTQFQYLNQAVIDSLESIILYNVIKHDVRYTFTTV